MTPKGFLTPVVMKYHQVFAQDRKKFKLRYFAEKLSTQQRQLYQPERHCISFNDHDKSEIFSQGGYR